MIRDQEDRAEQVASQMEQLRQSHLQELHTTRSDRAINRSYTPPRSDRAIYRSFTPTGQTEPFTGATHQQVRQSHLQELHTTRSDRAIYRRYICQFYTVEPCLSAVCSKNRINLSS